MKPGRFLELLEQDGGLLASTARRAGLDAPVPTCPGWTVRDCVAYTAEVYQHKVACMRLGRRPGDDYDQEPTAGLDVVAWFDASLATLTTELRKRGPTAHSYTWWPADQTVGFWYRRMAQETAVHRIDVLDALGQATPIDGELAVDGIDEVLDAFLTHGYQPLVLLGTTALSQLAALSSRAKWHRTPALHHRSVPAPDDPEEARLAMRAHLSLNLMELV